MCGNVFLRLEQETECELKYSRDNCCWQPLQVIMVPAISSSSLMSLRHPPSKRKGSRHMGQQKEPSAEGSI